MKNQFTIVVSHFIKEGATDAFEEALKKVIQKAIKYPGYQGIQIIRPSSTAEQEYILLIRFDSEDNYQIWANSEPRNKWFEELKDYTYQESKIRYEEGIEFWFSTPTLKISHPPRKWKMALLTWMVIYPSVLLLSTIVSIVAPNVPIFLRMLLVSCILVTLMTYFIMPNITRLFAKWIFDQK